MIEENIKDAYNEEPYDVFFDKIICPVVEYPEDKIAEIKQIIAEHKKHPSVIYDNVEEMFKDMGINVGDLNE